MTKPLRIGLLLDGTRVKRWELWILQTLVEREDVSLEVAVANPGRRARHGALRRLRKLPQYLRDVPWRTVDALDRRFAQRDASAAAMDDLDLAHLPIDVPVVEAELETGTPPGVHRFSATDLARIHTFDLDVLIRFGFNILRGDILRAARHGVWSFHHADNRVNRGAPPGFWEIAHGEPATGVTLQRLTEDLDNGQVLARGWYPTDRTSWNRNHQRVAARARTLLTDAVARLARDGEPPIAPASPVEIYCRPLYRKPGPGRALATAARSYARPFGRKLDSTLSRAQWHIRWGWAGPANASIHRLHRLTPPPDRLWADPFPYLRGGSVWLFVEELIYGTDRGRIVALEVDGNGVRRHRIALDLPYHLSYPYLFEQDGELYMLPESNANATVSLWRCRRFPDEWEHMHDILTGIHAADSSLLHHDERCYLFTTVARNASLDRSTELHIFHAEHALAREWRPHAANPVLVDCRAARMAGGFLTGADGSLIRCAQRHGAQYGEAIVLRRIDALTPEHYREQTVGSIEPRWQAGLTGTHHFAGRDGIVALDACQPVWRWGVRPGRASARALEPAKMRMPGREAGPSHTAAR